MFSPEPTPAGEYELEHSLTYESESSHEQHTNDDEFTQPLLNEGPSTNDRSQFRFHPFFCLTRILRRVCLGKRKSTSRRKRSCYCCRRSVLRRFTFLSYSILAIATIIVIVGGIFFPSYSQPPPRYADIKARATESNLSGRGNPQQQKIFIAASISDRSGELANGQWAQQILDLIDLLGPQNTFLSIYENNGGQLAKQALQQLEEKILCRHSLVYDEHWDLDSLPRVALPDGSRRIKRISYLAEVRNKALEPLATEEVLYDKLLYVNDVYFDPINVLQLLFGTNADETGSTNYRAACAVDFITPFKFYDTFATRDIGGHWPGIPIFPWFAYYGDKRSHQDVLHQKDAVRVRSCWGGIVAFDMRYFQPQPPQMGLLDAAGLDSPTNLSLPFRFRSEEDVYWDASECCLIQADIQSTDPDNPGIFMNPYVRVAYDEKTLSKIWFAKRFERLFTPVHFLLDIVLFHPYKFRNPRRDVQTWELVEEEVWVYDDKLPLGGSFQMLSRFASHAGFCGRRDLHVMKEGESFVGKPYEKIPVPS